MTVVRILTGGRLSGPDVIDHRVQQLGSLCRLWTQ